MSRRAPAGSGTEAWGAWGARTYGTGWEATKRRYKASRWTPHRCFWCLRRDGLQLNHLTYLFVRQHRVHGAGWTPLWTILPLCERHHRWETWLTRRARRFLGKRADRWAHLLVTLGGWGLSRGLPAWGLFAGEAWLAAKIGLGG